jgi:cellulose synthase/poly-beta-1,6-N-acetylglucosamine synthase-like glycosyltransferase
MTTCGLCVLFWCCLFVVLYPYVVYPLLLFAVNSLMCRQLPAPRNDFEPTVTVICPIHNESTAIEGKIRNLLESDYPDDRIEILVIGDGCTDDSLAIARRSGARRVRVIELPRAGKAAALNEGLARARGEVVIFTDAGIRTTPRALRALASHFAEPSIGCVSGEDRVEGTSGEGWYGRLELIIRREEARLHSIAGASGCLYAVRRTDCQTFEAGMAPDFQSVLDVVRGGKRAICEPLAFGYMSASASLAGEFTRKKRTFLRGMTALFSNASLLSPFYRPAYAFVLFSHKLLRWIAPVALVGAFVTALLLSDQTVYRVALQLQLALYALALLGLALPRASAGLPPLRICSFFVLVNAASTVAFGQWLAGVRQEVWEPTRRST